MPALNGPAIDELIARQKPGFSLEQPFYADHSIFERDMARMFRRQWLFVDHASRIPAAGDYLLYEIAGESIILLRDRAGSVRAHYNVCRHRGSRICLESEGNVKRLVCPYHAWAYDLDGRLVSARRMPDGFDAADYPLHPCRVRVLEGLIFVNLAEDEPPDFDRMADHVRPYLAPHGLERTKIAHREVYPTAGNWKLALENFNECYHCAPAHPEYTKVNAFVRVIERRERCEGGYAAETEAWAERAAHQGFLTGRDDWADEMPDQPHRAWREPIREGYLTLSEDGRPLAPLIGDFRDFDGAQTVVFMPFGYFYATGDHATLFRFTPVTPTHTDVVVTWLVHEDAEPGRDYDVERLRWMWHETTIQDTKLIGDNQAGVNSHRYLPGPYGTGERGAEGFVRWYLGQIAG